MFLHNKAEWWEVYGSCAPELQRVAIKVVSQTTSATNCERNWSTFSYIHTKVRNRLKYKKLQKLVFVHYNMKLRMRDQKRNSQQEIEESFNPINLDYIFQEDDPLSPWMEEREGPLLDGVQNSEWLPILDTDDEDDVVLDDNADSNGTGDGLSPPSNNSGDGGVNEEAGEGDGDGRGDEEEVDQQTQNDPYSESPNRRYRSLTGMTPSNSSLPGGRRESSKSRKKGKRKQKVSLEDSSSSSIAQSFGDFGIGDSSQSSQVSYPPVYHYPSFNPYNQYASDEASSYSHQSMNYEDPYHQQSSSGFYGYIFGQGATQDDSQSESRDYDPPRHSTMW